jgi:Na+/melibiose symporter-like transporter
MLETFKHVFDIYTRNPSLFQYTVIVTIFGILTALHWSFFFWFIEELRGKDPLLMGLCLFVQCFIGELPFFLIAHRIVNYCGPSKSLSKCLLAFVLKYFAYGYLLQKGNSYWDILLIEVTQGFTFGLFYCVMTALAQQYADKAKQHIYIRDC